MKKNFQLPRQAVAVILTLAFFLVHILTPWALSRRAGRHGWRNRRPGPWNLLALAIVLPGLAATIRMILLHFRASPDTFVQFQQSRVLITPGPYAFSRNPMYLTELAFWFGWSLFYGSLVVFAGCLAWFMLFNFVIVPYEERDLESRFGQAYLLYKQKAPRWVGKGT